ncbi:uncharacterized protein LOC136043818 isoform X2 [Artemia franciscana]|uniref:uncharacterized protein LOC136043818 isoform X2 n=1 Tax=Artemia franciscana TaxID=6661 RepID=UPI0032DAF6A7
MGHFGCYINYDVGAFLELVRYRWQTGKLGLYLCVHIAVALAVPSVRCKCLFDEGLEYVYSFNGYTPTGVKDPAVFGSTFGIQGTLTVQRQGPYATAKV